MLYYMQGLHATLILDVAHCRQGEASTFMNAFYDVCLLMTGSFVIGNSGGLTGRWPENGWSEVSLVRWLTGLVVDNVIGQKVSSTDCWIQINPVLKQSTVSYKQLLCIYLSWSIYELPHIAYLYCYYVFIYK